jgi:hypothetical protein
MVSPMARPLPLEFAGALYHLTSRGDRQESIFLDDGWFGPENAGLVRKNAVGLQTAIHGRSPTTHFDHQKGRARVDEEGLT